MNTVIALDMIAATLAIQVQVNALLRQAQLEKRDITDDELAVLQRGNDALIAKIRTR